MKTHLLILLAGLGLMHLHAAEAPAAPKGGKLFAIDGGHLEFFVNKDRVAEIVLYDAEMKPVPTGDREISVTAGTREKQEKLAVEKTGTEWTTAGLPAGDGYFVILQFRESADADPKTLRVRYLEEICSGCNLPEYACTCDHDH